MTRIDFPERPELPPELVKFRPFGERGSTRHQRVVEALQGRLHFSSLDRFNDPHEGRPRFVPKWRDPWDHYNAMKFYVARLLRERQGLTARSSTREAARLLAEKSPQEWVDQFGRDLNDGLRKGPPWVFCASDPDAVGETLMWSHYADSHRGVCIHFDTSLPPFSLAWPVQYCRELPVLEIPRSDNHGWEEVQNQVLFKEDRWAYEREYRLLRISDTPSGDERVNTLLVEWDGLVALAGPVAVVGVTIGSEMPAEHQAQLDAIVSEHAPRAKIWKSRREEGTFAFVRERVR